MYQKTYTLEGNDYTQWGNDDDYIKRYICDKDLYLGQPAPTPAPTPAPEPASEPSPTPTSEPAPAPF